MATTTSSPTPIGQFTQSVVSTTLESGFNIPTSILSQDLLSANNDANVCFTSQAFSNRLQMFLLDYVVTTSSYYSVYIA